MATPRRRLSSDIWHHFQKDLAEKKAICLYCEHKLSYGRSSFTSNLARHLQRKHPTALIKQKAGTDYILPSARGGQSSMTIFVEAFGSSSADKSKKLDAQLVKMICKEFHPFSLVEDEEFKELMAIANPTYILPSRKTLSNSVLQSVYNEIMKKITMQLRESEAVGLTCDVWVSVNKVCLYALTAHYIDDQTVLQSNLLECSEFEDTHTSQDLVKWIESVTKKFKIANKISAVITNDVGNTKAAVLMSEHQHLPCYAYSLDSLVQDAVNNSIKELVEKVKDIVKFFQYGHAYTKLVEMQRKLGSSQLELKEDDSSHWNSIFDMLERTYFNKDPIKASLFALEANYDITANEWRAIDYCRKMLSIFNEVTNKISTEKNVSLSKTSIMSREMEEHVINCLQTNDLPQEVMKLGEELLRGLVVHFYELEKMEIVSESIFLDPRFKRHGFSIPRNHQKAKKSIEAKLSMLEESHLATNEIAEYLDEEVLATDEDPLIWWESKKSEYPNLYMLVLKRLCIPATSVSCEKIFAKAGQISNRKRNRLTSHKLAQMLFVNYNAD